MFLVAIAWIYVVLLMAVAEATGSGGSVLGALLIVLFYGVLAAGNRALPDAAAARRAPAGARRAPAAAPAQRRDPGRGGHAPGDAVAPEREEP